MTDIEIAQNCIMRPITEIAAKAHVDEQYLEQYGRYKAKVDPKLLTETDRKNGKLILDKNGKPIKGAGNAADDNKAADDNNGPAKKNDTVPKAPPASPTPTGPAGKKAN